MKPTREYLLLIDGSSFIHRNFHALPRLTRQRDGLQTGALYGFCNSMLKLFRLNYTAIGVLPTYGAVILDYRGKNWRHELYPQYKAQRKAYDPDLEAQLPYIPMISEAFNVASVGVQGWEADDIIATYVAMADAKGLDTVIASSDKDLMQLVGVSDDAGTRVIMYDGLKDKIEDNSRALIDASQVRERLGVWPHQVSDFLALTGDAVDNVPGVPKIGPVSASRILNSIGDLDKVIEAAEWEPEKFKTPNEAALIAKHVRDVRLSRALVQLKDDVPVPYEIDNLLLEEPPASDLRGLMMDLEFMSLVEKVDRPAKAA